MMCHCPPITVPNECLSSVLAPPPPHHAGDLVLAVVVVLAKPSSSHPASSDDTSESLHKGVIGHGIGGKHISAKMAQLTESQSLE